MSNLLQGLHPLFICRVSVHFLYKSNIWWRKQVLSELFDTKPCRITWKLCHWVIIESETCDWTKSRTLVIPKATGDSINYSKEQKTWDTDSHWDCHDLLQGLDSLPKLDMLQELDPLWMSNLLQGLHPLFICRVSVHFLYTSVHSVNLTFGDGNRCFLSSSIQNHAESYGNYVNK